MSSVKDRNDLDSVIGKVNDIRKTLDSDVRDSIVSSIYRQAEDLAAQVTRKAGLKRDWDAKIDAVVTSRLLGYPIMLLLLGVVLWLTIIGSNYPSELLASLFARLEEALTSFFMAAGAPGWLHGFVVLGVYRGLAWVVSVMLPPMAIFFPLFTLLEDFGYLPRVAFNLDNFFKRAGAHGKQALTMAMGFGCNAAGVIAARIIESPRERMIAILTNSFVPCNGRFPTLIAMSLLFLAASGNTAGTAWASLMVVLLVLVGIAVTLLVSRLLSATLLKGESSSFALELPPYRKPQVIPVLVRSFVDRTLFVLGRAVMVAAPAGALTWLFANTFIGDRSMLAHVAGWLNPLGRAIGLDGIILLAFLLGMPANEIVIPIMIMGYLSAGSLLEADSLQALRELLVANGWTRITALNFMLFSLLHFPCGTTLLTIKKEAGGTKWAVIAALLTTFVAVAVCFITFQGARLLNLV